MKTVVQKHYERGREQAHASDSSRGALTIYTVSVDAEHLPAWGRYRIYPIMDPDEYFNSIRCDDNNNASIGGDFSAPFVWRGKMDIQM